MIQNNYCVYILRNQRGKLYIGQTNNLDKRLTEHNELGNGYTSKFRPWTLIHAEYFTSRKEIMAREKYLKTSAGRDWIKKNILGG